LIQKIGKHFTLILRNAIKVAMEFKPLFWQIKDNVNVIFISIFLALPLIILEPILYWKFNVLKHRSFNSGLILFVPIRSSV
jgi:hypothetical protein